MYGQQQSLNYSASAEALYYANWHGLLTDLTFAVFDIHVIQASLTPSSKLTRLFALFMS